LIARNIDKLDRILGDSAPDARERIPPGRWSRASPVVDPDALRTSTQRYSFSSNLHARAREISGLRNIIRFPPPA